MNKKNLFLLFLFAAVCLLCPFVISMDKGTYSFCTQNGDSVYVSFHTMFHDEIIKPFYCERDDVYYYALPTALSGHVMKNNRVDGELMVDGKTISTASRFKWDKGAVYDMEYAGNSFRISFLDSSNIPSLFITTKTGNIDLINSDKTYVEEADMAVIGSDGRVTYKGGLTINSRGNNTFDHFYKKPFHLTLDKATGLLGMKRNRDFLLLANSCDYSYMSNKLALDMAANAGLSFTPDAKYANVYLDGDYRGLYLVAEKIKVDDNRVSIGDGYLLERDYRIPDEKAVPSWFITKDFDTRVRIRYPQDATDEQKEYIGALVNEMEQSIASTDGLSEAGRYYTDYIDLESWIRYYVMYEIADDEDMGLASTYFYKYADNIDPKIYLGPVWDFDQSFGGDSNHYSPEGLLIQPEAWFEDLCKKPEFSGGISGVWTDDFSSYLKDIAPSRIDTWSEEIKDSVAMDVIRWHRYDGYEETFEWPVEIGQYSTQYSFDTEVAFFKKWLDLRCRYLDKCWGAKK